MIPLQPFILGSGMAGKAVAQAAALLPFTEKDLPLLPARFLPREADFSALVATSRAEGVEPLLALCNPPGLHASQLVQALRAGITTIFCEKPACVNGAELEMLIQAAKDYPQARIAIGHVYRQLWGPQTLGQWVREGRFGRLIHAEGRFWQASRVGGSSTPRPWMADSRLAGSPSIRLGLGTHWLDLMRYVVNEPLKRMHACSDSAHVTLSPDFAEEDQDSFCALTLCGMRSGLTVLGSIANGVHGAAQRLEVTLIGTEMTARWEFNQPDVILTGKGREEQTFRRTRPAPQQIAEGLEYGSGMAPFHALGWLEGYMDILRQMARAHAGLPHHLWPTLAENNEVTALLLGQRMGMEE
jgi:predicted dehydrogenase